ncbi:hypothetical protein MCACP_04850 [Neomoorella carbonis]
MTPEQLAAAKAVMVHGPMLLVIVVLAILFIIFATAKLKLHPLALILIFIIAAMLKTAQGSSTVALVTTSSLIAPMLPQLGLTSPMDLVLTVMAIGAGAMTVSHVNDSYFWVVSQFSGLEVTDAYKAQTAATLLEGLVTIVTTIVLFMIFH